MGYKNRTLEYKNNRNNLKGWELLVKFSNEFMTKNTKYNTVWNQCIYGLDNILKKPESQIKYNLLSHHTEQLVYIGKLNLNKNI